MTFAPRRPMRTRRQAFSSGCPFDSRSTQCRSLRSMSVDTQQVRPQHTQLHAANNKPWPCIGILAPALAAAGPSRAGEVSEAATDVATATAAATADLPPTVTFGGSFGQYDPIIAVFFYAVVAALLVLTLGVRQSHHVVMPSMHAGWHALLVSQAEAVGNCWCAT